ncbi:MAG: NAD(P)-binding domain-containing protein [Gemmatimonadetes bacterium]|nr:NAD(P)-binding domain-containing protein [Gemmatimonadota bacterium]
MPNIAILGTGLLGSGFAEAACKRGWTVTVWNRTASKAHALEAFGAKVAATPADAVRGADHVHLILRDDAVVEEVIAAARAALGADTVICDHTTTQPALTAARMERLEKEGVKYLHCPVFMGPPAARNAEGSMLVAGPAALFAKMESALTAMTGKLQYLGERRDAAAAYKLFGNAFFVGIAGTLADVFSIAKGAGFAPEETLKVLDVFNPSAIIGGRGKLMAAGNFAPMFELTMARKDVRLMIETAGSVPLAVLPGLAARMDVLIAQGHGAQDAGVVAIDAVTK